MNEQTTVQQVAPTQTEAVQVAPEHFTDRETVALVQRLLLEKGYVDGGPANGEFGQKTRDEILIFRARNNLQMIPVIDRDLIRALEVAAPKALPIEQVTATAPQIAPKVEVVAINEKVKKVAWWSKLYAWVTGIPAAFIPLLVAAVDNIDEATTAIAPLKNLFFDVGNIPGWVWFVGVAGLAGLFGYQAMQISKLSQQLEEKTVEGYQRGTIKNDVPPQQDVPLTQ
jgi:peptidoglycan hydrolase-like protein with peptidoglycan-binding domain